MEEILQRSVPSGEHRSVLSERPVGKSSLIVNLAEPAVLKQYSVDPKEVIVVYLSIEKNMPAERMREEIAYLVRERVPGTKLARELKQLRQSKPLNLRPLLSGLRKRGMKLVLVLNELENAATVKELRTGVLDHLRSVGQQYDVVLITASRLSLLNIAQAHEDTMSSPFFDIFVPLRLRMAPEESARKLLTTPLADAGFLFSNGDLKLAFDLAAQHPFFLQMAAKYLFDAYAAGGLGGKKSENQRHRWVRSTVWETAQDHFAYYWQKSEEEEKVQLVTYAALTSPDAQAVDRKKAERFLEKLSRHKRQQLIDRCLLIEGGDWGNEIFSSLFTDWILEEVEYLCTDRADTLEAWFEEVRTSGFKERFSNFKGWVGTGGLSGTKILLWLMNKGNYDFLQSLIENALRKMI